MSSVDPHQAPFGSGLDSEPRDVEHEIVRPGRIRVLVVSVTSALNSVRLTARHESYSKILLRVGSAAPVFMGSADGQDVGFPLVDTDGIISLSSGDPTVRFDPANLTFILQSGTTAATVSALCVG